MFQLHDHSHPQSILFLSPYFLTFDPIWSAEVSKDSRIEGWNRTFLHDEIPFPIFFVVVVVKNAGILFQTFLFIQLLLHTPRRHIGPEKKRPLKLFWANYLYYGIVCPSQRVFLMLSILCVKCWNAPKNSAPVIEETRAKTRKLLAFALF